MSGHTPGPWSIGPTAILQQVAIMSGRDFLAVVYGTTGENEANASLIASAPDLLEALESLTADRLFYYEGDTDARMNVTVAAYENARAAIARAKGEK